MPAKSPCGPHVPDGRGMPKVPELPQLRWIGPGRGRRRSGSAMAVVPGFRGWLRARSCPRSGSGRRRPAGLLGRPQAARRRSRPSGRRRVPAFLPPVLCRVTGGNPRRDNPPLQPLQGEGRQPAHRGGRAGRTVYPCGWPGAAAAGPQRPLQRRGGPPPGWGGSGLHRAAAPSYRRRCGSRGHSAGRRRCGTSP